MHLIILNIICLIMENYVYDVFLYLLKSKIFGCMGFQTIDKKNERILKIYLHLCCKDEWKSYGFGMV